MIKEIERPEWTNLDCMIDSGHAIALSEWFSENIEPHNKAIREGVEVYGSPDACKDTPIAECWYNDTPRGHTHKALLVGIGPTKRETREERLEALLKEFISESFFVGDYVEASPSSLFRKWRDNVEAALANEGE